MDVTSGVATFNLAAQVVLMLALLVGGVVAWKGKLRLHCWIMRGATLAQLVLVGVIMAPQIGRYYADWTGFSSLTTELVVHHAFAVIALLLAAAEGVGDGDLEDFAPVQLLLHVRQLVRLDIGNDQLHDSLSFRCW